MFIVSNVYYENAPSSATLKIHTNLILQIRLRTRILDGIDSSLLQQQLYQLNHGDPVAINMRIEYISPLKKLLCNLPS